LSAALPHRQPSTEISIRELEEQSTQVVISIAEMQVSDSPDDVLVTYSLGSCIGLSLYDHEIGLGGLIHCMLPVSKTDPDKAARVPCTFVDTGVPALMQAMFDLGATRKTLVAKVAGASNLLDRKGMFRIGERNYSMLKKVLWKNRIKIAGEHVAGTVARTMFLCMANGATIVKTQGRYIEL
jgi:chemotaxis protein CheD